MTDGGEAGSEEQSPQRWHDRTNCLFIQGGVKNRHHMTKMTDEEARAAKETTVGLMGVMGGGLQKIHMQMRW